MENWKSLNEGYEVSNLGNVRSLDRYVLRKDTLTFIKVLGKVLKQQPDSRGYLRVSISINNIKQTLKVHRLVAEAFIPNPENKPQVNHIDGNKQNNHVSNLEWVNNSENQKHATAIGLKRNEFGIKARAFSGGVEVYRNGILEFIMYGSREMLSFGFDPRLVSACLKGKRKTHKGCSFIKQTIEEYQQ